MTTFPHRFRILSAPLLGLLLLCGCQTYKINTPTFVDYPEHEAQDATVALRFNEAYSNHVCEVPRRSYRVPLGDALERNSVYVAEQFFDKVHVVKGAGAKIPDDVQAVLTPTVVGDSMSKFISVFDKVEYVIDVEWKLEDRQGDLIWLKTVRGKAKNGAGTIGSIRAQGGKRIRAALEDLFAKTHEAIATSPAIREFAEQQEEKQ